MKQVTYLTGHKLPRNTLTSVANAVKTDKCPHCVRSNPFARVTGSQLLTVSATRKNEIQQLTVTFTGNTTDNGGKMMEDAPANVFFALTFDSGSMNWACTDASLTTANVSSLHLSYGER